MSDARRSAQTTIYIIVDGLTRLIAPILPITADELWRNLPGTGIDSVHLADFPKEKEIDTLLDQELIDRWTRLLSLRDAVNGELEKLRQNKVVGTSLEATVTLTVEENMLQLLETYLDDLPMLFITSTVTVVQGTACDTADGAVYSDSGGTARINVRRVDSSKCPRCWRWVRPVEDEIEICERCVDALSGNVPPAR